MFETNYRYGIPTNVKISLHDLGLVRHKLYNFYESFSGNLTGQFKYNDVFSVKVDPSGSVFAFWTEPTNSTVVKKSKNISI